MALSVLSDYQLAVNEILWAWEQNLGWGFPFYDLVRTGGLSEADARTLRTAYESYKITRSARPTLTPAHPDKVSQIDSTDLLGRTNSGSNPSEDKGPFDETSQTGR